MASFLITHKAFDLPIQNKEKYTVLSPKGTTIENWPEIIYFDSPLDNRIFSELSAMIWIRNNIKSDFITINHYRRLLENMPFDICYAEPINIGCSIAEQYKVFHNIDDLMLCSNIIKNLYPELYNIWLYTLQSPIFYPYNMVSFPQPIYSDYIDKMSKILFTFLNCIKVNNYDDMLKRIETIPTYTENNNARNTDKVYQARLVSFLAERITSMYINYLIMTNNKCIPCFVKKFGGAF